jgi:Na+/proline symporter
MLIPLIVAVFVISMATLAFLAYKETTDTLSDFFTGPPGIGVAVAVVIIAGTAAWHRLKSKEPKRPGSPSSESEEPES